MTILITSRLLLQTVMITEYGPWIIGPGDPVISKLVKKIIENIEDFIECILEKKAIDFGKSKHYKGMHPKSSVGSG